MNKADLVAAVHARHPDPMTPGEAVAAVLNAVAAALADGDDVQPGTALARAVAEGRLPDRPITVRKPARG